MTTSPQVAFSSETTRGSGRPTLAVCMIVRDNEGTIEPCLASIKPWVDEMIVVDTGSQDETPAIAKRHGAQIFHFPWCDDFAAARNESLRHARSEWLFWMDSDDTIPPECGRKLRHLAYGPHAATTLGYVMQVHCPGERSGDLTVVDHVKMFRNHPEVRFEFRLHEQVLMSIRRLGGEIEWTDIHVVHSGSDRSLEGRRRKYERDLRILSDELATYPDHPFVLFNLGMTYSDMEEHALAIQYLRRCLEVSGTDQSHLRKAYALLVCSLEQASKLDEAYQVCVQGLELFPEDVELLFRRGILSHALGQLDEAEQSYLAAIASHPGGHFASFDPGVASYKSRHNLALVYQDMGQAGFAEVQWRQTASTSVVPGRRSIVETLLQQHRLCTAEIELEGMLEDPHLRCDSLVLSGLLAEARGDMTKAKDQLWWALSEYPDDRYTLRSLCRFLFERGEMPEAEEALQRLTAAEPNDGSAHHNLGIVYTALGRRTEAIESFRRSLEVRPESSETQRLLADALALEDV